MKTEPYDSADDTRTHIGRVQELLGFAIFKLTERSRIHDLSKLSPDEKPFYDTITVKLKGLTYGSEEYKASLAELSPALRHHYEHNPHHPEHYPNGINGMSLLDMIEMLCDWKAAGERHADGSMQRSLDVNKTRFKISDQLHAVLVNTARELKML